MKLRRLAVIGATVAVLGLAGCGGTAPVRVDTQTLAMVHTVAIVKAPEPNEYTVINKGSPAAAMGALGGAAIAMQANKDQKGLLGALARKKFSFADQLTTDLQKTLQQKGYKTKVVVVKRESGRDLLKDHNALMAQGIDAVLDVATMEVGYSTEHFMFSPFWRPEARVEVGLFPRGGDKAAYDETFMYGYHNPLMSGTDLDAPDKYHFNSRDEMEAAADDTLIGGLKDASMTIAQTVADKLAR